jgi:hypothetical protein
MTYPIIPPPELVQEWEEDWHHSMVEHTELEPYIAAQAAQWGADQELEACCEWLNGGSKIDYATAALLRADRRPKPPSLKEQALRRLDYVTAFGDDKDIIRHALEALDD